MLFRLLKSLPLFFILFPLLAQSNALTVESYAKLPPISLFSIAPSGKKIAYRITDGEVDFLQVYDLEKAERIGLIDISDVGPTSIQFIDEERVVLVSEVNTRLQGYQGRHDVSYAVVFNVSTKKIHKLLEPGHGISIGQTEI